MRYLLVKPVPNGYAFWEIADTQNKTMPNFPVVTIAESMPDAARIAYDLCEKLNKAA